MILYLNKNDDITSHQIRMILKIKDIDIEIIELDENDLPDFFEDINANLTLPVLLNQSISLYDEFVIIQYLDERFPHPTIMSHDPINRAIRRRIVLEIKNSFYPHVQTLENSHQSKKSKASREALRDKILEMEFLIANQYMLDDELDILDIIFASILWRLKKYKITLPENSQKLKKYIKNIFQQPFFRTSLTKKEIEMNFAEKDKYTALHSEKHFNDTIVQIVNEM